MSEIDSLKQQLESKEAELLHSPPPFLPQMHVNVESRQGIGTCIWGRCPDRGGGGETGEQATWPAPREATRCPRLTR